MKNKNNIAFSVILPVYNQASFVRRAIKSMMAQTYDNWELIIVNDGSTDRTAEFVASFIDGARVRYISSPENEGLGRALNRGLDAASNDYITYLPADDFYDGSHLEKMADAFRDNENAAVVFSGIRYDESEEPGVMSWRTCKGTVPGHALQLVQTAHRKTEDRWTEREELVTEDFLSCSGVSLPAVACSCQRERLHANGPVIRFSGIRYVVNVMVAVSINTEHTIMCQDLCDSGRRDIRLWMKRRLMRNTGDRYRQPAETG